MVVAPQVMFQSKAQLVTGLHNNSFSFLFNFSLPHHQISQRVIPITPILTALGLFSATTIGGESIGVAIHFYTQLSYEQKTTLYSVSVSDFLQDQINSLTAIVLPNHRALDVL